MNRFYAYTRVSTQRQGEKGVSLQEQHAAIARYAERHNLQIAEWLEERVTAAKKGRPLFNKMLKGLRSGHAQGVIIHKIDRSARNLRDWSDLGELIDSGISVHFANESIDLQSRGGRLSADIQAVVASDYIRNLREETIKGMRGRLKQGVFPWNAPIGYLNTGSGQPKDIDPVKGPLVRRAFELYASGRFSLNALTVEMSRQGLANARGKQLSVNGLSCMLKNPFYIGLMKVRTTGEVHEGRHQPLVSAQLFQEVRAKLTGKCQIRTRRHNFPLRGLFSCQLCSRQLIGERQKGRVYYRCHAKGCPTRSFREDALEDALFHAWPSFAPTETWRNRLRDKLRQIEEREGHTEAARRTHLQVQIDSTKQRIARLVDVFVDGGIDKQTFEGRRQELLERQAALTEALLPGPLSSDRTTRILEAFELACTAQQSYRLATPENRRELILLLSSNLTVRGKDVVVEPYFPIATLANRAGIPGGDLHRSTNRTISRLAIQLWAWFTRQ